MQEATQTTGKLIREGNRPYYELHMFICTNRRNNARSCGGSGSEQILSHAKRILRSLQDNVNVSIRVNASGCMGRCQQGPVVVVYPEGIWYRCDSRTDIEAIISRHMCNQTPVDHLRLVG